MRFTELLSSTVLASAAGASVLVLATLVGLPAASNDSVVWVSLGWWTVATLLGLRQGRGARTSEAIAPLLAAARTQASLPEVAPTRTLLNRLWPLGLTTVAGAGVGLAVPQVPAVIGGFMILWALAWRRQPGAVRAIEERDGARFYVAPSRPWQRIRLIRTPGFRATRVELDGAERPAQPG